MASIRLALLIACLLAPPAFAQSNPYNGSWTVSFDGKRTIDLEGTVVVKDEGGTWRVIAQSRSNPCVGREAPITVTTASDDELVFKVNRSQVLTGCGDWTMRFKKVDDNTLTGQLADGRPVSLIRK